MTKIDDIVNDIYDPKIEDPTYQSLMALCIKAWLQDALSRGIALGREELALEMETSLKKSMNPDATIVVVKY